MMAPGAGAGDPRVGGVLAECARVQQAIEEVLDCLPTDPQRPPPAEGWSPAQVMWHLATVQRQVTRLLEKGVAALPAMVTVPPGASWPALVASVDRLQLLNRGIRVDAPEGVRPPDAVVMADERGRWAAGREAFSGAVVRLAPQLTLVRQDHPILGSLDGWQWALFMVRHEERHLRQLEGLA